MTTLGVELPDGSVLFGKPRRTYDGGQFVYPAWMGGLTADEYQQIMEEVDHGD